MISGTVPGELVGLDQWICWRNECRGCGAIYEPDIKTCPEDGEKTTKRPVDPVTGRLASTTDPETWGSFDEAADFNRDSDVHGVGFVFSEDDQMAGVDLDDCRDPETGEIDGWAESIVGQLASFSEVSPSGTGIHVYVYGSVPDGGSRRGGVEMYDSERYFTVTGDHLNAAPRSINYRQDEIERVHEGHIDVDDRERADVEISLDDIDLGDVEEDFVNDLGMSLEEIRDQDAKLDDLLAEINPSGYGYPSPSEADYAAAGKLWFWRFTHEQIVKIFHRHRYREKAKRPETYLGAAAGEQYDPRPGSGEEVQILDDRTHYDSISEVEFPDGHFVLDKPPREGGSHASMAHLAEEPIVVLTARHAIGEHHLGILDDVMPEGACAVHLVGRRRACENPNADECENATETFEERWQLEHEAKDAVHRKRVVTAEDCPDGFCRHQFIKFCEKHAHAVVTVPQLLGRLERDLDGARLLIDEEQALGYFRPGSTELVKISQMYEPDGTRVVQLNSSNIGQQFRALRAIRDQVKDEQESRKEQAEEEGRQWRRNSWEIDIENAVDYLESIKRQLGVTETVDRIEVDEEPTVKSVMDDFRARLDEIERPEPRTSPSDFRDKLADYTARFFHDDSVDPGAMIEAALFPYEDRPFDFKRTGPAYTLRMIGGRTLFGADLLRKFDQIGVIAGPEGEMFFEDLDVEAETIIIDEFRYADDFVIVPMAKESNGELESPKKQRRRARQVSGELNRRGHPHMAVTGTKDTAENHLSELDEGLAVVIGNPESPAKDIYTAWTAGETAVIYENSVVSRGIDAPPFDISVVVSSGFATPYWEARSAHYRDVDEDEFLRASAIESELKSRELTNAVLRPAATPNIDEYYGTKFIVAADWDVPRIRYLHDRVLPRFGYADKAANFLEQLTIGGGIRATLDDVYDEVGGDEREFLAIATTDTFKETVYERPSFTLEELTKWRERWWLTSDGTLDQLRKAFGPGSEPISTEMVVELIGGWSWGRVIAGLKTLEKKGIINSFKESGGESGQQKTYWELNT